MVQVVKPGGRRLGVEVGRGLGVEVGSQLIEVIYIINFHQIFRSLMRTVLDFSPHGRRFDSVQSKQPQW